VLVRKEDGTQTLKLSRRSFFKVKNTKKWSHSMSENQWESKNPSSWTFFLQNPDLTPPPTEIQ